MSSPELVGGIIGLGAVLSIHTALLFKITAQLSKEITLLEIMKDREKR